MCSPRSPRFLQADEDTAKLLVLHLVIHISVPPLHNQGSNVVGRVRHDFLVLLRFRTGLASCFLCQPIYGPTVLSYLYVCPRLPLLHVVSLCFSASQFPLPSVQPSQLTAFPSSQSTCMCTHARCSVSTSQTDTRTHFAPCLSP